MNKYDFIQQLLENKKITSSQKERILLLTKEEIKLDVSKGVDLEKRVQNLENMILTNLKESDLNSTEPKVIKKNDTLDERNYIPSKNITQFLKDFNQNQILKTACHEIDSNEMANILEFCQTEFYDFKTHLQKINHEFRTKFYNNKKYIVDHKIKNLILAYLSGETFSNRNARWTDESVIFNWNSVELAQWCSNNKGIIPHPDSGLRRIQNNIDFKLPNPIKSKLLRTKNIQYFGELVLHFKYLFHIRADNSLHAIISNQNSINQWTDKITFEFDVANFPKNIELFTNVEKLIQAYNILINLIIDSSKEEKTNPIVKLKLLERDDGIQFSIHHRNSVFKKSIKNTIERNGQTFQNLIKNQINGLCDFYLNADFGTEGLAKINIWDGKPKEKKEVENITEGVEYILIFRK